MKKIIGILNVVKKFPLSTMGNPRYKVQINNKIFETKSNASLGYSITNYDNRKVVASFETYHYKKPKLMLVEVKNFYQEGDLTNDSY